MVPTGGMKLNTLSDGGRAMKESNVIAKGSSVDPSPEEYVWLLRPGAM